MRSSLLGIDRDLRRTILGMTVQKLVAVVLGRLAMNSEHLFTYFAV